MHLLNSLIHSQIKSFLFYSVLHIRLALLHIFSLKKYAAKSNGNFTIIDLLRNKPRDNPTSPIKCSRHFNDLQNCTKMMSRSIFTRKVKWDIIFEQYCKSFYTLRQKQMLHVLYNIIDISRKLFVNCACRYQDCEVYVSFFKC